MKIPYFCILALLNRVHAKEEASLDRFDFDSSNSRSLQGWNQDCALSGSISCTVIADNSDCMDIGPIRKDLCGEIPIRMEYTYCNGETLPANKILILPKLSFLDLYEENTQSLAHTEIPAGQCKSTFQNGIVDTCVRGRVNAELEVEGWKEFEMNYGNYCHIYVHYFPKIEKVPAPLP